MKRLNLFEAVTRLSMNMPIYITKQVTKQITFEELQTLADDGSIVYFGDEVMQRPCEESVKEPEAEPVKDFEEQIDDILDDILANGIEEEPVKKTYKTGRMTNEAKEKVLRMYAEGDPVVDISDAVGYSVNYCYKVIEAAKKGANS